MLSASLKNLNKILSGQHQKVATDQITKNYKLGINRDNQRKINIFVICAPCSREVFASFLKARRVDIHWKKRKAAPDFLLILCCGSLFWFIFCWSSHFQWILCCNSSILTTRIRKGSIWVWSLQLKTPHMLNGCRLSWSVVNYAESIKGFILINWRVH